MNKERGIYIYPQRLPSYFKYLTSRLFDLSKAFEFIHNDQYYVPGRILLLITSYCRVRAYLGFYLGGGGITRKIILLCSKGKSYEKNVKMRRKRKIGKSEGKGNKKMDFPFNSLRKLEIPWCILTLV